MTEIFFALLGAIGGALLGGLAQDFLARRERRLAAARAAFDYALAEAAHCEAAIDAVQKVQLISADAWTMTIRGRAPSALASLSGFAGVFPNWLSAEVLKLEGLVATLGPIADHHEKKLVELADDPQRQRRECEELQNLQLESMHKVRFIAERVGPEMERFRRSVYRCDFGVMRRPSDWAERRVLTSQIPEWKPMFSASDNPRLH